jgi:hypothetical protein
MFAVPTGHGAQGGNNADVAETLEISQLALSQLAMRDCNFDIASKKRLALTLNPPTDSLGQGSDGSDGGGSQNDAREKDRKTGKA